MKVNFDKISERISQLKMADVWAFLIRTLIWPWSMLPLSVHYKISPVLAFLMGKVFKYRRDTVEFNLARAFPEKSFWDIQDHIVDDFYQHLADVFVEAVWFGGCDRKRLRESHIVEISNAEVIARMYENSPSVMILYSHTGNWELFGGSEWYNYRDVPYPLDYRNICVTYRKMSSKPWDKFFHYNRTAPVTNGMDFEGYIESKEVVRYIMRNAANKKAYYFITDQRPYYSNSGNINVRFLNQNCTTMSAGAALAHKMGMSVCFLKMPLESRGHYRFEFVPICDNASEMSVEDIMKRYYELLEEEIREQPFNYLWTHRRWAWQA